MNAGSVRIPQRAAGRAAKTAVSVALFGLAIACAPLDAGAFAQARPDYAAAARGIVDAQGLQTAFPNPARADPANTFPLDLDLTRWLLWGAVVAGLVVLALYLRDILPGGRFARRGGWSADETESGQAGAGAGTAAQTSADELARLGRFVEAMHVLLLQAVADMHARLDQRIADSLTSREILRRAAVPPVARSALGEIIGAVERAYFGDHPAGEGEYRACRTHFSVFVGALRDGRRA
ncbi:MAG: DUF4129 domain-containing protein [Roseiarcus sp.]